MSHNKIKVNNLTPNTTGNINVDVEDLGDVTITSLATNDVLQYDGTGWENVNVSSTATQIEYILAGQAEANAYSNSTTDTNITLGSILNIYDTSPVNAITGATITKYSTTDWITSITLPAGKYQVWLKYRVDFSASGVMGYGISDNSGTKLSGLAFIGESLGIYAGTSNILQSIIELSSQTTINIRPFTALTNVDTVSNQGNVPSEYSSIYIEKLSN